MTATAGVIKRDLLMAMSGTVVSLTAQVLSVVLNKASQYTATGYRRSD